MNNGISLALRVFHKAVKVPAYRRLLEKARIRPAQIKASNFSSLPMIDKQGYIDRNKRSSVFLGPYYPPVAYASSGSSGKPTFWFRDKEKEEAGGSLHKRIVEDIYKIPKDEPTLVIVCFSMGIWVAGNFTAAAFRHVSDSGHNLTVITPGIEMVDIHNILKTLAPEFRHVILAGYPPFVMDVITGSLREKISLPKKFYILTAGDKVSEGWRDALSKFLGQKDLLHTNVNLYGCADAGVLAFETPATIAIRRLAESHKRLYRSLYGEDGSNTSLFQYDPDEVYFEQAGEELVFTAGGSIPLVRYNIHDVGHLISFREMSAILGEAGLARSASELSRWNMPFLVKRGRTDVSVVTYALNIYPDHIKTGIDNSKVSKSVSGNFLAYTRSMHGHRKEQLCFEIELAKGIKPSPTLRRRIADSLFHNLIKLNAEYRKLHSAIGQRAFPKISLVSFGKLNPVRVKSKVMMQAAGKKPRMYG